MPFETFEREFGPPIDCRAVSPADLQKYEKRLPAAVIAEWRRSGLCAWGEGLLRLTHPDQLAGIPQEWLDPKPKEGLVFLRTAFADLYFWDEGAVFSLDVHYGRVSQVTSDVELFFDAVLCDERVQERSLRRPIYREALKRLGPPADDECYAFVPALALGGTETAESVQRVKLREHLDILRQVVVE